MTRAKLVGLRRNLAVAIGNCGGQAALNALDARSEERPTADDPMVQQHIAWARTRKQEGL